MSTLKSIISEQEVEALVRAHINLQMGCYFSKVQPCLSGLLTTSRRISDYYWNLVGSFKEPDIQRLIEQAQIIFLEESRKPSFYIDPACQPYNAIETLESIGFICEREIWMSTKTISHNVSLCPAKITQVGPNEISEFLRVFSIGFGGPSTSSDGYGDIPPEYLDALKDSLKGEGTWPGVEHIHFIARIGSAAVGCGSVHVGNGYAGLYNVTTLPDYRKQGIAASISQEGFKLAYNKGAKRVFLQTQPNGSVQRFYESLGCEVIFEAAILHKE